MTIEKFLLYWDHHNTAIIEGLIAAIVLLSLFLAYRSFFAKKDEGAEGHASHGAANLDAAQLEKTLQKILENQHLGAKLAANANASGDDLSVAADIEEHAPAPGETASADDGHAAAEVAQLRASLAESTKKMELLKTQLLQAQEQATAAKNEAAAAAASAGDTGAGAGSAGPAGMTSEERNEMDAKLRDLEARLAEYEIISEDIADLSRYREENDELKKQIEALKSAGASASTPAPPSAPAMEPSAPQASSEPTTVIPPSEPPKLTAVPDAEVEPAVIEPAASADAADPSNLIDDDLMKEFAAAVEGQKSLSQAAEKAGDGSVKADTNSDDTNKLMDQFEDFVGNKKS